MTDETVIKIHGITNEMLTNEPCLEEKLPEIRKFLEGGVVIAHHAPFDMGFLAWDFERYQLPLPEAPAVCSSLLSRALITDSPNHKLQTLIKHLNLPQGQAHRATDDARACLQVGLHCMEKLGTDTTLKEVLGKQSKRIYWSDYSIKSLLLQQPLRAAVEASESFKDLDFIYQSGKHKGRMRRARPLGIVRNPNGDFMPALCYIDHIVKRFYLNRIIDSKVVPS